MITRSESDTFGRVRAARPRAVVLGAARSLLAYERPSKLSRCATTRIARRLH